MTDPMRFPRTLDEALAAESAGRPLRFLHFWGEEPDGDGLGPGCLSQWWLSDFSEDGRVFASAEHYMMAHKAWLFGDSATAERILQVSHPGEAKRLGRQVRGFDDAAWTEHRFDIVMRGNVAKFGQRPDLKAYLLGTRDRVLVEASPVDRIWGIGLRKDDYRVDSPASWRGLNLLGFALMAARDLLSGGGAPTLRRAVGGDAARIGDVFSAARAQMAYLPHLHSDEETRTWIEHVVLTEHEVWVAELDGEVVGFAALRDSWLDHLYVDPARQGAGVGSALLHRSMRVRANELNLRVFERNEAARRFYERHRFSVVGRSDGTDNEERLPDVHYRWSA